MSKRLIAGVVVGFFVLSGPGVEARSAAAERVAAHQREVGSRLACNRAMERQGLCPKPAATRTVAQSPSSSQAQRGKRIVISIAQQRLRAYDGDRLVIDTAVSTGTRGKETPTGTFKIQDKHVRYWSNSYKVWMPYAMRVHRGIFIHEIPITPDGRRLGAATLGRAVSAGCIRMGIGPAKALFDWTPSGTPVVIH